jgi:D-3-phosphoglycerate dehydrogenase
MNILCIGDAMIPGRNFERACDQLEIKNKMIQVVDWEDDWDSLQKRRLVIEKEGPKAEPVLSCIMQADRETEILLILYAPVSPEAMDGLPNLKLIGAARAGLENIDIAAATKRGILVHNIMGRNANAVSDFAIGLLLAEARNIGRAHHSMKMGVWRKSYVNSDFIPELSGRTIGIVGFGYIGRLVARKISGFSPEILVYDPYASEELIDEYGGKKISKEDLFGRSDFITIHARLTEETKGLVGSKELEMTKPTSILINTARADLIDEDALYDVLKDRRIAGAALDVFWTEPIPENSKWLALDNVTLTPHIAGTTGDALRNSPYLLVEDINKLLLGEKPNFLVNPEVLDNPRAQHWLSALRG